MHPTRNTVVAVAVAAAVAATVVAVRAAAADTERVGEIAAVADRLDLPFAWRDTVDAVTVGCRPAGGAACPLGSWDPAGRTLVVSDTAFDDPRLLTVVVAHELAHVHTTVVDPGLAGELAATVAATGGAAYDAATGDGIDITELAADCLAVTYGAPTGGWWRCPPGTVDAVARIAGGDRSGPAGSGRG